MTVSGNVALVRKSIASYLLSSLDRVTLRLNTDQENTFEPCDMTCW
jgi:hypothetical protein